MEIWDHCQIYFVSQSAIAFSISKTCKTCLTRNYTGTTSSDSAIVLFSELLKIIPFLQLKEQKAKTSLASVGGVWYTWQSMLNAFLVFARSHHMVGNISVFLKAIFKRYLFLNFLCFIDEFQPYILYSYPILPSGSYEQVHTWFWSVSHLQKTFGINLA